MWVFFFFATFGDGLSHAAQTFLPGLFHRKSLREGGGVEGGVDLDGGDCVQDGGEDDVNTAKVEKEIIPSNNQDDDKNARTLLKRLLLLSTIAGIINSFSGRFISNNAGRAFSSDSSLVSLNGLSSG